MKKVTKVTKAYNADNVKKGNPIFLTLYALSALVTLSAIPLYAAIEGKGAFAVDTAGTPRTNFNSTEQIGFWQKINNTTAGSGVITFTFSVTDPVGATVFSHAGNAAPAAVAGEAVTQVAGMLISQIYTQPGNYTLTATANHSGVTVTQSTVFNISSPLITLLYPPNGITDLVPSPLTFSWSGSGASTYRISVDDDPAFYNVIFEATTLGPETTFTYPDNPTDPRQNLAANQPYYWKVEGLDVLGNEISEASPPFEFRLKQPSSQTSSRDIAVTSLEVLPNAQVDSVGAIVFEVLIANQGGQTEVNIPVNLYMNGVSGSNSPKTISSLGPNETEKVTLNGSSGSEDDFAIAQATIDVFDDNISNNSLTLRLDLEELGGDDDATFTIRSYLPPELWEICKKYLSPGGGVVLELDGFGAFEIIADDLTAKELNALIDAMEKGTARITRAWISD